MLTIVSLLAVLATEARAQVDESATLEGIRPTYNLPGLSTIVLKKGHIIAQGATGLRRIDATPALRVDDRLNFASCTKFMTATIAARLVDRGVMQWTQRVRDSFPEYAQFNAAFPDQTLDDLLAHRAGVQEQVTFDSRHWNALQALPGTLPELRAWVCDQVLQDPPDVPHGTYLYSNLGYTVAARMMELATGKSWEQLIDEEVFRPLRLESASLGVAYTDDAVNPAAPVGHDLPNGVTKAVPRAVMTPEDLRHYQASNAAGGYVICTLADYAKFLYEWVDGGDSTYLSAAARAHVLTPWEGTEGYAHGVSSVKRTWADPGVALNHSGDIFGHDTVFWAAPAQDLAVVVFTNCRSDDNRVFYGMDAAAWAMISRYVSSPPSGPPIESPKVAQTAIAAGNFTLQVQTLPGLSYRLQRSTDLTTGVWTDSDPILAASDWNTVFSSPSGQPRQFFRVKVDP